MLRASCFRFRFHIASSIYCLHSRQFIFLQRMPLLLAHWLLITSFAVVDMLRYCQIFSRFHTIRTSWPWSYIYITDFDTGKYLLRLSCRFTLISMRFSSKIGISYAPPEITIFRIFHRSGGFWRVTWFFVVMVTVYFRLVISFFSADITPWFIILLKSFAPWTRFTFSRSIIGRGASFRTYDWV